MKTLHKLQLVQPILYELQLVQTACISCNLYRLFVQVATCTKSQLVHSIYIEACGDIGEIGDITFSPFRYEMVVN